AFSTDSIVWKFLAGTPAITADGITLELTSLLNFQRIKVPNVPVSRRCPWAFPSTAAQRVAAANDPTSIYYQCGYSPDISGGVGNTTTANLTDAQGRVLTDGAGIFVQCDYTRSSGPGNPIPTQGCMARLGKQSDTSFSADGNI